MYAGASQNTKVVVWLIGGVLFAVLIYWLVVRYIGKNVSSGKPYVDPQSTPTGGTTTGSNNGGTTQQPPYSISTEDPFKFANELQLKLEDSWFGICSTPDDTCYRLQKLANGGDAFIQSVGRAYQSSFSKKLSAAIGTNPCGCTPIGSATWGRQTNYPIDKKALANRLVAFGY